MERRVRRLEVAQDIASGSVLLRRLATDAAAAAGLDPELVLAEAEAILNRCAGLSLPEIAAQEGIDLAELESMLMRSEEHKPA
jgi:hypothetical protein